MFGNIFFNKFSPLSAAQFNQPPKFSMVLSMNDGASFCLTTTISGQRTGILIEGFLGVGIGWDLFLGAGIGLSEKSLLFDLGAGIGLSEKSLLLDLGAGIGLSEKSLLFDLGAGIGCNKDNNLAFFKDSAHVCFCFGMHESEATIVSSIERVDGNFCRPLPLPPWKLFWKTCGMETSISISELSIENGVVVVDAYGSILGDNEDHVNNI